MNRLNTRLIQLVCHSVLIFSVFGCSPQYHDMPAFLPFDITRSENRSVGRFKTSYLADQIDQHYRGTVSGPIGVTTFVNINDLYSSSTFGRVYAEQLMSELAMRGFDVVELRHADALQYLGDGGEFALSRDTAMVRPARELAGVVVGTYVVSPVRVYVNARLVDPSTSVVLSAASVEMSRTKELTKLLRDSSMPSTLERIPVRHLGQGAVPMFAGNSYNDEMMPSLPQINRDQMLPPPPSYPTKSLSAESIDKESAPTELKEHAPTHEQEIDENAGPKIDPPILEK
jgi:TolB-like protein